MLGAEANEFVGGHVGAEMVDVPVLLAQCDRGHGAGERVVVTGHRGDHGGAASATSGVRCELTEEPLQEVLAQVKTPVFLLRAGETWLPEESEIRERLRRVQGPLTIETLEGTAHHLHLEQPVEVAARVARAWAAALH